MRRIKATGKRVFARFFRTRRLLPTALLLLAVLSGAPRVSAMEDAPLKRVTLQLRWLHQFQFAGYYAALEKGFYRDEGLDVVISEGGGGKSPIRSVLEGKAQFGVTNSEVLYHRLKGEPLVVLAAIFQHSPLVLVARAETDVHSPQDLVGKKVKMTRDSRDVELHAMFLNEGISLDRIDIVEGETQNGHFFDPQIAATAAYLTNEPFLYHLKHQDYNTIKPITYGIDFYGDCLFTSENVLKKDPDAAAAFRRASLKGWLYAMQEPAEMVDLIVRKYGPKKSRAHLLFEAGAMRRLILPDLVEMGHMNEGRWRHIAETFVRFDMIPEQFDLKGFMYDPNPPREDRRLKWAARIGLGAGVLAGLIALILFVFNNRLQSEIRDRKHAEAALNRRLEGERLVSAISSLFISTGRSTFSGRMHEALALLGAFTDADRCAVFQMADGNYCSRFEWRREGIPSWENRLRSVEPESFPWVDERLARLENVFIPDTEDLPPEAAAEKRHLAEKNVRSAVIAPMAYNGELIGTVAFDWVRQAKRWVEEDLTIVRTVAEIFVNASETRRAKEALDRRERQYHLVYEQSPLGIIQFDENGVIMDCNSKFEEIVGAGRDRIIGLDMLTEMEDGPAKQAVADALEKGSGYFEGEYHTLSGKKDIVIRAIHQRLLSEDGRVLGGTGFMEDIARQRQMEAQLRHSQKMESLGTLAGGIAHDFNNLLMGILGNTSLVLSDLEPASPHEERLRNVEAYVKSATELTRQLLGFARGGKYEVRPTDINRLLDDNSRLFGRTRKEITIRRRFAEDLRAVDSDQGQLDQVFMNLYVNAWQAMPGGGEISLATGNILLDENAASVFGGRAGRYVQITVADTGVGMDAKTLSRIFDPFFTTKGKRRGTGLGLASCYGIIKNHGGNISATSNPGRGTVFTIMLPASDKAAASIARPSPELIKGKETVLLVDDEEMILNTGRAMLEQIGYSVLTADSGMAAVDIVSENGGKIDLVVLDMIMPKMGGRETFEQIKKHRPDLRVLLSSGYSIDGQAGRILEQGCDGFIQKPFTLRELSAKVREVLDVRRGD